MGHWINLDRRAKTPLPALRAARGCNWPQMRGERGTGRVAWLPRNAGAGGTDTGARLKGGAACR